MLQLGVPLTRSPDTSRVESWTNRTIDFQHLLHRYRQIEKRVNELGSTIDTLASLAGNRVSVRAGELSLQEAERAGRESRSVKALTVLGIIFLSLSFTAYIFSMADSVCIKLPSSARSLLALDTYFKVLSFITNI
ncbi:hypothetical protein F4813DRAFT_357282 [Daldinia decipiens]|uniref:uncharacterized protein n=1 Tax=Daldinia decipiens TaxID=326647 RepID=UPI0020C269F8|nr:uncharacterized protein F4813DRAFT_357282 [Daldinia decipiens]KAI1658077.1 hypothetical protein F4813DRAFT_357282 [Daldinia decipiens]